MKNKKVITHLLGLVFLFQLHFWGALPPESKIIGDILLFLLLVGIYGNPFKFLKKKHNFKFYDYRTINFSIYFSNIFLIFILFEIVYSYALWNDLFLILRQARRWIIAGIYFRLILSDIYKFLDYKVLKKWLMFFNVAIIIILLLNIQGYVLPFNNYTYSLQGGQYVLKPFIPGTLFLYFSVFLSFYYYQQTTKIRWIVLTLSLLIISVVLIPFRGWVISSVSILIIMSGTIFLNRKNVIRFVIPLFIILVYIINTNLFSQKLQWATSAFQDFEQVTGNYKYRYIEDISRLSFINNNKYSYYGIGFLNRESTASKEYHISNETNDTGWVEVLLTGGYIGAIVFLLFYLTNLINYIYIYSKSKNYSFLFLFVIWLMSGVTMISSNFLLWDFGYVPIFFMSLFIISRERSKKII